MDNRTGRRIKKLENADVDTFQNNSPFRISEELFDKLDLAQQEWLPDHVKVEVQLSEEYEALTDAFFNNEISRQEYDRRTKEISDYEGFTDEEFRECYKKHGGLGYSWTPERLDELKAGKVPTE